MSDATHHDHGHSHGPSNNLQGYYTEQLLTIGACGALAGIAMMQYFTGKLDFILHPKFHLFVLVGAILLMGLVIVRATCLWISVGEPVAEPVDAHKDCGHDHGPGCGHDHDHDHGIKEQSQVQGVTTTPLAMATATPDHGHSHGQSHGGGAGGAGGAGGGGDDGHGHGWAPWRFVVLLLPVALFFLDLPNKAMVQAEDHSKQFALAGLEGGPSRGKLPQGVSFVMLEQAALSPDTREFYTDKEISLEGVFAGSPESNDQFTLTRPTMNCCAADAITLSAIIRVNYNQIKSEPNFVAMKPASLERKWVKVTGSVKFLQPTGGGPFKTVLIVTPTPEEPLGKVIELLAKPPANQYAY